MKNIKNILFFGLTISFVLVILNYFNSNSSKEKLCKNNNELSPLELAIHRNNLEFEKTRDPKTNRIPVNISEKESYFVKQIPTKKEYYFGKHPVIQTQEWKNTGPNNISGRINCLDFDVKNENIMIVASASGGLWRTTNAGNNWEKVSPPDANQAAYCIAQDKSFDNSNVWYAGTGELLSTTDRKFNTFARTTGLGNGILKSTDNGLTWFHLQSTKVLNNSSLNEVFQGVWDIKIDTMNNTVYAACHGAIMKSTNSGDNWEPAIGDLNNQCFSTDFAISNSGIYYAALSTMTQSGEKPEYTGIWSSEDGVHWNNITPKNFPVFTRIVKIKIAPSNPNILYVLTEIPVPINNDFYKFLASHHTLWKYIYNPDTKKGNWKDLTSNLPYQDVAKINKTLNSGYNSLGGYCITLNVKPDNENIVFLGGTNLFRSNDAFETKNYVKIGGYSSHLHPDQHYIAFLPSNSKILFSCSDGGITRTNNCMASKVNWQKLNNDLTSSQFYSVAIDKASATDELIVGGIQDQGVAAKDTTNSQDWELILGGDGMSCSVSNRRKFIIMSVYSGQVFGGYFTNYGQLYINYNNYIISDNMAQHSNFNFYTNFVLDSNNNNFYILAKNVIWRYDDISKVIYNDSLRNFGWTKLTNTQQTQNISITALAISKNPAYRLYYGNDNGQIFRMDDANTDNPTSIEITGDDFPKGAYTSSILIDPRNADKVFAVFSNYNVKSIFYSTDGGAYWTNQGGNLEENPDGGGAGPSIRWIDMLYVNNKPIYFVGTSSGLFSTLELSGVNTTWVKEGDNSIGNAKIDMITTREIDGYVAIATQGNGIYQTFVKSLVNVQDNQIANNIYTSSYPNPASNSLNIKINLPQNENLTISIYDLQGDFINKIYSGFLTKGENSITVNISNLNSGTYFYQVTSDKFTISKKFQILK